MSTFDPQIHAQQVFSAHVCRQQIFPSPNTTNYASSKRARRLGRPYSYEAEGLWDETKQHGHSIFAHFHCSMSDMPSISTAEASMSSCSSLDSSSSRTSFSHFGSSLSALLWLAFGRAAEAAFLARCQAEHATVHCQSYFAASSHKMRSKLALCHA